MRVLTRYRDVRRFLTDPRFSRSMVPPSHRIVSQALSRSVMEIDPPEHTSRRRFIAGAFTVRRVERLRPRIALLANGLLDEMRAAGPPADLVRQFSAPLAFAAQCEVLGIGEAYRAQLRHWSHARFGRPGTTRAESRAAEARLHACVVEMVDDGPPPAGGLLADLLDERALRTPGRDDVAAFVTSLFFDGHWLAAAQIANAVLSLQRHPDQLAAVRRSPGRIARASEELLRWCPAANHSLLRVAVADVELDEGTVIAGEIAAAALRPANRDAAAFPDPDALDVTRTGSPHLSFGHGPHYCLGAHLARVELQVALAALLHRLPGLRLVSSGEEPSLLVTHNAHAVVALPVGW